MLLFHAGYLYNVGYMKQVLVVRAAHISQERNYIECVANSMEKCNVTILFFSVKKV
jgi:hypothetical protein